MRRKVGLGQWELPVWWGRLAAWVRREFRGRRERLVRRGRRVWLGFILPGRSL